MKVVGAALQDVGIHDVLPVVGGGNLEQLQARVVESRHVHLLRDHVVVGAREVVRVVLEVCRQHSFEEVLRQTRVHL